jgi:1-acyl-sn-glycerol-3-phosphate acyltransferase
MRFAERDRMILVIAPEGTRSQTPYWKSGFYWVARAANVPIALGYLDYARRRGGISEPFMPSESLNDDVKRIRDFYARVTAKYPELFTNIELRPVTV